MTVQKLTKSFLKMFETSAKPKSHSWALSAQRSSVQSTVEHGLAQSRANIDSADQLRNSPISLLAYEHTIHSRPALRPAIVERRGWDF